MLVRLLLGLLKGAVIGAAIGFGAFELGLVGGWGYLVFGVVGFVVGLFVGRPVWSHLLDKNSTIVTSILKGLVGAGVCIGLFAVAHGPLGDPLMSLAGETHSLTGWTYLFGGLVGGLYGAFVEIDDTPAKQSAAKDEPKPRR